MSEDKTLARIHDLMKKLRERLTESEDLRATIENLRRESNRWPEMRRGWQPEDLPELPYFRAPDDETH